MTREICEHIHIQPTTSTSTSTFSSTSNLQDRIHGPEKCFISGTLRTHSAWLALVMWKESWRGYEWQCGLMDVRPVIFMDEDTAE